MRIRRALGPPALLLAAALASRSANAQPPGFALDRFEPSERGSDWFVLESLDLRGHLRPAFGVVGEYAYRPLAFYDANGNGVASVVRNQLFAHAGASVVLWERVRFGVNLPIAIYQDGQSGFKDGAGLTAPASAFAAGDLRLGGDVRLLGHQTTTRGKLTFAAGLQAFLPTGSRDSYTSDGSVRVQPRLLIAGDAGIFAYAGRVAVQYRAIDDTFAGTKVGTELLYAASAGLRVLRGKLLIGPELFGSTGLTKQPFRKTPAPLEALVGGHLAAGHGWHVGLGAGAGLTRAFGTSQARIALSIEWARDVEVPPPPPPPIDGDRDGDGIRDSADACPDVAGIAAEEPEMNGCPAPYAAPPDRDGDGIPDATDACPETPGVKTEDPKTNGCPPDRDKDGIPDEDDACPDVAGVETDDPQTNGCPLDPDRDKDGIPNEQDACPDEPGKPDPDPKRNGCPIAFVVGGQIKILDQVKFKKGSAQILPGNESEEVLVAVLEVLKAHAEITKLRVEGHTDNLGAPGPNKKLSAERAASVVKWLVSHGVEPARLSSAGFGLERPLDSNLTEEGRNNNRRVELHIEPTTP